MFLSLVGAGLNIGSWAVLALHLGCTVVSFEALIANAARATQTVVDASPTASEDDLWLQRFVVYHNAVGKERKQMQIKLRDTNPGSSTLLDKWGVARLKNDKDAAMRTETIAGVVIDDLLFDAPLSSRPLVLVDGKYVPLQPEHIAVVKVDIEGYDVPALYGLRRLLESEHRPSSVMIEFAPTDVASNGCDPARFIRYMYGLGYKYEQQPTVEGMLSDAEVAVKKIGADNGVREGWWDLQTPGAR
jgi:FkbM family methyltransferase